MAFTLLNITPFTSKPNVLLADTKVTELLVAEDLIEIEEIEKIEEVDEIVEDINNEEDSIETPPLEVEEDEAQENKENSDTIVEDEEKNVITDEKKI